MPSDEDFEALARRVDELDRQLATQGGSALGRSVLAGNPRITFKTTHTGPNGTRYVLTRAVGGNAVYVPAPAVDSDWSDA